MVSFVLVCSDRSRGLVPYLSSLILHKERQTLLQLSYLFGFMLSLGEIKSFASSLPFCSLQVFSLIFVLQGSDHYPGYPWCRIRFSDIISQERKMQIGPVFFCLNSSNSSFSNVGASCPKPTGAQPSMSAVHSIARISERCLCQFSSQPCP